MGSTQIGWTPLHVPPKPLDFRVHADPAPRSRYLSLHGVIQNATSRLCSRDDRPYSATETSIGFVFFAAPSRSIGAIGRFFPAIAIPKGLNDFPSYNYQRREEVAISVRICVRGSKMQRSQQKTCTTTQTHVCFSSLFHKGPVYIPHNTSNLCTQQAFLSTAQR